MADPLSISYVSLFTDPGLMNDLGAGTILEDLPPTTEFQKLLEALGPEVDEKAPAALARSFKNAAGRLKTLLEGGGDLTDVRHQQRGLARVLKQMPTHAREAIVAALQKSRTAERFASIDEARERLHSVMRRVDVGAGQDLATLGRLTAIPSVSDGLNLPNKNVLRSAEAVAELLRQAGFKGVRMLKARESNASVYGEITVDPAKPTVLLYAHHDVQPVGEGWETEPFRAFLKEGRVYGRGAADDKGGFIAALAGVQAYLKAGLELPVNVAIFVEGEEEIGSPNLEKLLAKLPQNLNPDVVVVLDSENVLTGLPTVAASTRGVVHFLVKVQTAKYGTHAGLKGYVTDAITASASLLVGLRDQHGDLTIAGLTDQSLLIPSQVRSAIDSLRGEEMESVLRVSGGMLDGVHVLGDPSVPVLERIGWRYGLKTLAFEGTQGIKGAAGVNVHRVSLLLQFRIPPGIEVDSAAQKIGAHLQGLSPFGAHVEVARYGASAPPWLADLGSPRLSVLGEALKLGYGREMVSLPIGGSIPFLSLFQRLFPRASIFPVGIEDPYTNAHGANESLSIPDFVKTARSIAAFLALLGQNQTANQ